MHVHIHPCGEKQVSQHQKQQEQYEILLLFLKAARTVSLNMYNNVN